MADPGSERLDLVLVDLVREAVNLGSDRDRVLGSRVSGGDGPDIVGVGAPAGDADVDVSALW